MTQPLSRTPVLLAAVGGWLASAYWAALTVLIFTGVAHGSTSAVQVFLPSVLIALYAWRGFKVFKGDPSAASSLIWLHAFGALMAVLNFSSVGPTMRVLYVIKIAIHAFGAATAFLAHRALTASPSKSV